jgi:hypothetical protein
MREIVAVDAGGIPLVVQVLSSVGGFVAAAAAVFVAIRTSRSEHRQWLRARRLEAYSTFLEVAAHGHDAIYEMLRDYPHCLGQLNMIEQRASKTNEELGRPISQISLLGPDQVRVTAGAARLSFAWEAKRIIEFLAGDGVDGDHPQVGGLKVDLARLELTREQVDRWAHEVSEALERFKLVGAKELEGSGSRPWPAIWFRRGQGT